MADMDQTQGPEGSAGRFGDHRRPAAARYGPRRKARPSPRARQFRSGSEPGSGAAVSMPRAGLRQVGATTT
jgi:hypothetical protein